jgi:hypothetical protein
MSDDPAGKRDFFVSFNKADRLWATWIVHRKRFIADHTAPRDTGASVFGQYNRV